MGVHSSTFYSIMSTNVIILSHHIPRAIRHPLVNEPTKLSSSGLIWHSSPPPRPSQAQLPNHPAQRIDSSPAHPARRSGGSAHGGRDKVVSDVELDAIRVGQIICVVLAAWLAFRGSIAVGSQREKTYTSPWSLPDEVRPRQPTPCQSPSPKPRHCRSWNTFPTPSRPAPPSDSS